MEDPTQQSRSLNHQPRFKLAHILFPLVVAIIVLSILSDMIPQFKDAREKFFYPAEHQARQACHAAALAAASKPAYARIRTPGKVHATQGASYVEGVSVGEMGASGAEVAFNFSCYVDSSGTVVKSNKQTASSSP